MDINSPTSTPHPSAGSGPTHTVAYALGVLLLSGLGIYMVNMRAYVMLWMAWAAPLIFLVFFGLVIHLYPRPTPADHPVTWRRRLLLTLVPLGALALVYLALLYTGFTQIYAAGHLSGVLYALLYVPLTLLELSAASERLLPSPNPAPAAYRLASLRTWLVPAPGELPRAGFFWFGWVCAFIISGLQDVQLNLANALFRSTQNWLTPQSVPFAAVLALGLLYFILAELLLVQSAGLWRAIRAGQLPAEMSARSAYLQVIARWGFAISLGWLTGGTRLLMLLLALCIHQALDILSVERLRPHRPSIYAVYHSFNPALRFMLGALAVIGTRWSLALLLGLFAVAYFIALAQSAGRIRTAGLGAALLLSLGLLVLQSQVETCTLNATLLGTFYARCSPQGLVYLQLGGLNGTLAAVDVLVLFLLLGLGLARIFGSTGRLPVRRWLVIAAYSFVSLAQLAALLLLLGALMTHNARWLMAAVVLWLAAQIASVPGSQPAPLRQRLAHLGDAWREYLFNPNSGIPFLRLLALSLALLGGWPTPERPPVPVLPEPVEGQF